MDEKDETQIKIEKMLKKAAVILEAGKDKRGERNERGKEKADKCTLKIDENMIFTINASLEEVKELL